MYQTVTISAGQRLEFYEPGDFFRLMEDGGTSLQVEFYYQGREIAQADSVRSGYAERFKDGKTFDRFVVTNIGSASAAVQLVARLGQEVAYDSPPTGQVSIANGGNFVHAATTVTTASSTIAASNAQRRYLLIQNKDTSGTIWVRVDGGAATQALGVMIEPGASWEITGRCPTAAITAIGDAASNTNITIVEG